MTPGSEPAILPLKQSWAQAMLPGVAQCTGSHLHIGLDALHDDDLHVQPTAILCGLTLKALSRRLA